MSEPTRPTLSTATPEEIAEALVDHKPCARCQRLFKPKRFWQRFCSASCRTVHHNEEKDPVALQQKLQVAYRQEAELLREIEELKAEVKRLQALLQAPSAKVEA